MSKKILDLIFIKAKTAIFNKFLDKTPVFYFSNDVLFKKNIKNGIHNSDIVNAEVILNSIVKYIEGFEKLLIKSEEKPIKLYILCVTDYMTEDEKIFQITVAHQKVDPITKVLNEHRVELHYLPNQFSDVQDYDIRLEDEDEINIFLEKVRSSKGFSKSLEHKPIRVLVESEEV